MSKRTEIFQDFLNSFETEELRLYCEDMIDRLPEYVFQIPSSTSLKYHNATQCQAGGQVYHVLMTVTILNYILGLEYIKLKYPKPKQRDCMRIAMCLHDGLKCGLPEEGKNNYTIFQHPLLVAEWIRQTKPSHDIKQGLKDYIARLCESHSGEWTTNKKTTDVLPKPETDDQFIIHLCDYLGSRNNLDMIYANETKDKIRELAVPDPENWFFPWGKYKGMNWWLVYEMDKDYLIWLRDEAEMPIQEPLKSYLREYL